MKSKISKLVQIIITAFAAIILSISFYVKYRFGNAKFEQLLYSLKYSNGTSIDVILDGVKYCLPITLLIICIIILITNNWGKKIKIKIKIKNTVISLKISNIKHQLLFTFIVILILLSYSAYSIGLFTYVKENSTASSIFEEYYVDPNNVKLKFPDYKQNLIYIYIESMESSYTKINLNNTTVNLIPNLEKIAKDNVNFSNTAEIGGAQKIYGTTWTIAGTVAQTAGIPLKLIVDNNSYDHFANFLPGVTSLGDILAKNGYNQYYMIGSQASFAGKDLYFKEHGNYTIYDYEWAKENNKIEENYKVFWGFEDKKLFKFAKEQLIEIAQNDKPFNFTILTADTHAPEGYIDSSCNEEYQYKYANAIKCNDKIISDFVNWIRKQPFYKNTTIILTGDHLTMQGDIENYINSNERTIYNATINSRIEPCNTKNRLFTSMDFFPTTLASLGVEIEGERLGLGTNLYSNKKTLIENYGIEYFENQLSNKSNYYNSNFLQKTYSEMIMENEN